MSKRVSEILRDAQEWGAHKGTHVAVALAIRQMATGERTPDEIWEAPTIEEFEAVGRRVVRLIDDGVFSATADGNYNWGAITIRTARPNAARAAGSRPTQSVVLDLSV